LQLAAILVDQFWDDADAGFFFTGKDHETLIARVKDAHDSSIPSGNALAATGLLRLAKLTGRADLYDRALATLRAFAGLMDRSPLAAGQLLVALDFHLGPVQEVAIVGDPEAAATRRVLRAVRGGFRPHQVVALKPPTAADADPIPLLAGKTAAAEVTTYLCQNFTCQAPLLGPEAAEKALNSRASRGA
jgi:uncharacterized protein YyaL (SSP411 family)